MPLYNIITVSYLYETHLHTAEVSKCAVSGGAEYIAGYIEKGYTGIIVTDHFFNANSALSKKLPWEEWVNRFYMGYERAKKEGDRQGLDVFFGWEEAFEGGDEYLVYGLDKEWLLEHPEVRSWTRGEQYRAVREAGGCVIQAHPFRQRSYISRIVLSTGCVDGVEAVNGGHEDDTYDALAYRYAQKAGKPVTAGTDIHNASDVLHGQIYGVYLEKKLNSIGDFVNMILNKEVADLKICNRKLDSYNLNDIRIPVEIRDENDNITCKHFKELL